MRLSLLLREYAQEYGYSQVELCRKTGLSQATISNLLNGIPRLPRLETIEKLAKLGFDRDILLRAAIEESEVTTEERRVDSALKQWFVQILQFDLVTKQKIIEFLNALD